MTKEIIRQHLTYEIEMLFATQQRLQQGESDRIVRNALIESFCVHARNLIDFLRGKRSGVTAKAVTHDYKPFVKGEIDKKCRHMIEEQITQLGYGRTANPEQQINGHVQIVLARALAEELIEFQRHVRPGYSTPWTITPGDLIVFKKHAEAE
jgi:hypothetical protein